MNAPHGHVVLPLSVRVAFALVLVAGLFAAAWPGCSTEPPTAPERKALSPGYSPEPGLFLGPVAGLTTAWHAAPRRFSVPRGTMVLLRCDARLAATVTWHGARETSRDAYGSMASCPIGETGHYEITVEVTDYPSPGDRRDRRPQDVAEGEAGTTTRLSCEFDVVDVDPASVRVSTAVVRCPPLSLPENPSNWEMIRAYSAGSVASLQQSRPGEFVIAVETNVEFDARIEPAYFSPLVEWRANGQAFLIGNTAAHQFEEPGRYVIEAGPPDHSATFSVDTYRVASIRSGVAPAAIPDGENVTFEAVTEPSGFERYVTWVAASRYGSAHPFLGQGATFTTRFENTVDDVAGTWTGIRADGTTLTLNENSFVPCTQANMIAIATAVKQLLGLSSASEVWIGCEPVAPGTQMIEDMTAGEPVVLAVPATPATGLYYTAFIDDAPGKRWGHPGRFLWIEYSGIITDHQVISADWPPRVSVPGESSSRPQVTFSFAVGGTVFRAGPGRLRIPRYHSDSHKPDAAPPTGGSGTANWQRKLLAVDLGDIDETVTGGLAEVFSVDADGMADWLTGEGFDEVVRVSQYWGNNLPCLRRTVPGAAAQSLDDLIRSCGQWFDCHPDSSCCHEFFLYIGGHGSKEIAPPGPPVPQPGGFFIMEPTGSGRADWFSYPRLYDALVTFPPCVKIIVFIDACFSGGALPVLDDLCSPPPPLLPRTCGVTLVTTSDALTPAEGGGNFRPDSGTQDFLEINLNDYDNDGKIGDFYDPWRSMELQGYPEPDPLRFKCTPTQPMCSTD